MLNFDEPGQNIKLTGCKNQTVSNSETLQGDSRIGKIQSCPVDTNAGQVADASPDDAGGFKGGPHPMTGSLFLGEENVVSNSSIEGWNVAIECQNPNFGSGFEAEAGTLVGRKVARLFGVGR